MSSAPLCNTSNCVKLKDDIESVINSQFSYAPIIYMFGKKTDYYRIEKIHHRALKVVHDCEQSYKEPLLIKNDVSVYQIDISASLVVVLSSLNNISLELTWSTFTFKKCGYQY